MDLLSLTGQSHNNCDKIVCWWPLLLSCMFWCRKRGLKTMGKSLPHSIVSNKRYWLYCMDIGTLKICAPKYPSLSRPDIHPWYLPGWKTCIHPQLWNSVWLAAHCYNKELSNVKTKDLPVCILYTVFPTPLWLLPVAPVPWLRKSITRGNFLTQFTKTASFWMHQSRIHFRISFPAPKSRNANRKIYCWFCNSRSF